MNNSMVVSISKKNRSPSVMRGVRRDYEKWRRNTKESKILLATLFALAEGECPVCGGDMILSFSEELINDPRLATLDHITPLSVVLEHKKYGLQIMCRKCNGIKADNKL